MRRRVSLSASAGVSSPQPMPTILRSCRRPSHRSCPPRASSCSSASRPRTARTPRSSRRCRPRTPNANAPLQSVMIAIFTSPPDAGGRRARPTDADAPPTTSSASGSRSFHLRTFIVFLLSVPARATWSANSQREPTTSRRVAIPPSFTTSSLPPPARARLRTGGPPRRRAASQIRSQSPIRPSGETMTMARKMKPMTVLKVPPITGKPVRRDAVRHLVVDRR